MRDLWWTLWQWDGICFERLGFRLSVPSTIAPKYRLAQKLLDVAFLSLNIGRQVTLVPTCMLERIFFFGGGGDVRRV